jgi:hypothetical protein
MLGGSALLWLALAGSASAQPQVLAAELMHLRNRPEREWSSFAENPQALRLQTRFAGEANDGPQTLILRQQDVKQGWRVALNQKQLGELARDENDLRLVLAVPRGALRSGENVLSIECAAGAAADDIRVGQILLDVRPPDEYLGDASVEVTVVDDSGGKPLPCRITVVDGDGALQPTSAFSKDQLAARIGVIYSGNGKARFQLPAGKYTIYAGRGFEYSLAQTAIALSPGETARPTLILRQEVPTAGYVACDTHIHTLTHSGHGDATIAERMITLAGEGIELPIATDHNVHIDYEGPAKSAGVRAYFTPVMGNEVTTPVGHFNVFPVAPAAQPPNHRQQAWPAVFDEIFRTPGVRCVILNHARDLHSNVRPFGPQLYNAAVGENLRRWPMRFCAMEVVNSGATQTDPLQLTRDWMTLINRGYQVTPVGSSDSHDVTRFIVGQGRTYIRCDDRDPGAIDTRAAMDSFLAGRVMVGYGLLCDLAVDGRYRPGDLAAASGKEFTATLRVLGPHWTKANRVDLYANGVLIRQEEIPSRDRQDLPHGVQWQTQWRFPLPAHDVHLVAVAVGEGVSGAYWPTAKPYQPTSPEWQPYTLGISGSIRVDADGDGRWSSAYDYAGRVVAKSNDLAALVGSLTDYDSATAAQAAHLWQSGPSAVEFDKLLPAASNAAPHVQAGFREYFMAWRQTQLARAEP